MNEITTVGLDLAKMCSRYMGSMERGRRFWQFRRAQVLAFFNKLPHCLVGMEACATAHYRVRELRTLGHECG